MKPGVRVRTEAARSLDRVVQSGAFSNVVVHQTSLEGKDRSKHQLLVFSALRWLIPIDGRIEIAAGRPIRKLEPMVRSVLRILATELIVLGHDAHGVVDSAVEAVSAVGVGRAKGLVNAVGRAIASSPGKPLDPIDTFPAWMLEDLDRTYEDAADLLASFNEGAPVGLRLRNATDIPIHEIDGIPDAGYASDDLDVTALESAGAVDVIDPASVAVANAVDVREGMSVADLAAAPGGKTRAIADAAGGSGLVVAADVHRGRVRSARRRSKAISSVRWLRADARRPPFAPRSFDRVLLDAPCTGLGSVRRRPEIRHRITQSSPDEYRTIQRTMLERAMELVRPGGRIVYSVCTLFPQETSDVVAGLGFRPPEISAARALGDGVLLNPLDTGTDGMFIAIADR